MRKVILSLLFSGIGLYAMGQNAMVPTHSLMQVPTSAIHTTLQLHSTANTTSTPEAGWYDAVDEANNNGSVTYSTGYNHMFYDSTVQCLYNNGTSNTLQYVTTQDVGEVFDPMAPMYDSALSLYNIYNVDSVALFYLYNYVPEKDTTAPVDINPDGLVHDTLIFQFYTVKTAGIDTGVFQAPNNEPYGIVKYNPGTKANGYDVNLGVAATGKTFKYILGAKDTCSIYSANTHQIIVPALNSSNTAGIPISLITNKKNGYNRDLFAYTVSYRPGFKWKLGDTIDEALSPAPKHLHSHFRIYESRDMSKSNLSNTAHGTNNYEMSLNVSSTALETVNGVQTHYAGGERYGNDPGWPGLYVPGTAWNNFDQVTYSAFYLDSKNNAAVNQSPVDPKGYILGNVYPNPASGTAKLNFALGNTEQVKITMYDMLGHEIAVLADGQYTAGTHAVSFNTDNLKEGIYLYSINAGSFSKTLKFTVAHN